MCACFGIGKVFACLTASSKAESKFKVIVVEEFIIGVASVCVHIFQGQEALVPAVLSSSKWQKGCVSTHGIVSFVKVAKVRGGLQIAITNECVNLCAVQTFPTITARLSPVEKIKELSFGAPTGIGIDLWILDASALLALLSAFRSSSFPVVGFAPDGSLFPKETEAECE
jgi:hypothetical protein